MNRQKAIEVVKEIGNSCKLLNPKEIDIEETDRKGHFEIRVKCHVDDESWECMKKLAKQQDLGVRLMDHTLVIYAPLDKRIGKLTLS